MRQCEIERGKNCQRLNNPVSSDYGHHSISWFIQSYNPVILKIPIQTISHKLLTPRYKRYERINDGAAQWPLTPYNHTIIQSYHPLILQILIQTFFPVTEHREPCYPNPPFSPRCECVLNAWWMRTECVVNAYWMRTECVLGSIASWFSETISLI